MFAETQFKCSLIETSYTHPLFSDVKFIIENISVQKSAVPLPKNEVPREIIQILIKKKEFL